MTDIRTISSEQLKSFLEESGHPKFRCKQVEQWIWQKGVSSFDEMSNLPAKMREDLSKQFQIPQLSIAQQQKSTDGTIKLGIRLHDGFLVEGVLIPTSSRMTACISSQVGCSLTCKFCATGRLKRERNLFAHEIVEQVRAINQLALDNYSKPLTNIVLMGMGEPLLNYQEVTKGIHWINSENGLGMANRRVTLSTAGIAKMIKKLGDDKVKFKLALSLHAADDEKRSKIMPINEQNSLDKLVDALDYFYQQTKNKITFEYILFKDFNDSLEDADNLIALGKKIPSKVNIIEYNPIGDDQFKKVDPIQLDKFVNRLHRAGIAASVRRSRGKDIDAACGQLANKTK